MNPNIMEALAVVLSELQRSNLTIEELSIVSEMLSRQGFSPQEISAAIDLLQQRSEMNLRTGSGPRVMREPSAGAWRILTRNERAMLSPEAEQLLMQSQRTGIFSPLDVDNALLEAARDEERPISRDRMMEIITILLMEKPPAGSEN